MNEVYSDSFVRVYQSDEGHTYVAHVDGKNLVMRKHCLDFVAEVKFSQISHDIALSLFAHLSEAMAESIAAMLP